MFDLIRDAPIEEKRAWILLTVSATAYTAYLLTLTQQARHTPLSDLPYAPALLWSVALSIMASILLSIAVSIASPRHANRKDQRDADIHRIGEYTGQSFLVIGGVAALIMSMLEIDHFWIANALYLAFVLSALLGSAAKIVMYRKGL